MPISINSDTGNIFAGGDGSDGDLVLRANDGANRVRIDGGGGNMWLGGNGADGDLVLFRAGGDNVTLDQASLHLDGNSGDIFAGGQGVNGNIALRGTAGQNRIRLDAGGGNLWVGGNGADGDIVLFAAGGDNTTLSQATIHLNGDAGDIILQNADCAEDFAIEDIEQIEPGTVMVIGDHARLRMSREAYDRRVAGVVAGAGSYRPGIVLGRKEGAGDALPIALVGRIFCKVDADQGAVAVGDMLTSAPTPGHAMKAADPSKAFGAVIGKALGALERGQALVPTLVALQ